MPQQFDLFASKAARDDALAQVAGNSGTFMDDAICAIADLPKGMLLIGEDIRRLLTEEGIVPHHHNAWGALTGVALRRKLLRPTGRYRYMRDVNSHGRRTAEYVR